MPAGRIADNRNRIRDIYGFFVGIDQYQDPSIASLMGCVRDAESMLSAFNPHHKEIMLNKEATRKNILGVIQAYVKNLKTRDLLIFSVSAHGAIVNSDFSIVTYDTQQDNLLGTVLPTYYALTALSEITKNGGRVLIILDTCHAGAINFDIGKYSGILSEGGMSCLNSSGPNEQSYEATFKTESGDVQQGVFTRHLIDGLNGKADHDGLRIITLRDLYDYIYGKVSSTHRQHPVLIGTLEGNTILKAFGKG
ncbi:MAG TPA: caspase family protein [Anaerolineales bacterium]|nr:caspase family protein [Anaerolineales bacterium]